MNDMFTAHAVSFDWNKFEAMTKVYHSSYCILSNIEHKHTHTQPHSWATKTQLDTCWAIKIGNRNHLLIQNTLNCVRLIAFCQIFKKKIFAIFGFGPHTLDSFQTEFGFICFLSHRFVNAPNSCQSLANYSKFPDAKVQFY